VRLIQFTDHAGERRVGIVSAAQIEVLAQVSSMRELALLAVRSSNGLERQAQLLNTGHGEPYVDILSEQRILAPLDHADPGHCLLSGTGLTHTASASTRDKMHRQIDDEEMAKTDTLHLFEWGIKGGRPAPGQIGVQPEWFYKGNGSIVVPPGHALPTPDFALDAGEEPELAALYLIDDEGCPRRLGFAIANEFSDHVMERRNYLYQAHSKLRHCSFGPELLTGPMPQHVVGMTRIRRHGRVIWEQEFLVGQDNMSHSLDNLEYHLFKYDQFLQPGDVHVHFLGAATLSFAYSVRTKPGDSIEIAIADFGEPLVNSIATLQPRFRMGGVKAM